MSTWSENGEDIFVVFRKIRDKAVVLWHNKDILLDVELARTRAFALFHARTWAFAFPQIAQFSLFSLFRGSLVSQNVLSKQRKVNKECSSPTQLVRFLFIYGDECDTCMFGVFTAGFSVEQI